MSADTTRPDRVALQAPVEPVATKLDTDPRAGRPATDLDGTDATVLGAVSELARDGQVKLSQRALARRLGLSRSALNRRLNGLAAAGLVKLTANGGGTVVSMNDAFASVTTEVFSP